MTRPTAIPNAPLVGRHGLLAALMRRVEHGERVVVLVGLAGSGKSAVAAALVDRIGRPVQRVDGAGETEAELYEAVSAALKVPLESSDAAHARPRLGEALATMGPVTVLLDGVPCPPEAVATAVDAWTTAAPEALFVITRRSPLPGLVDHTTVDPLDPSAAARLFVDRARRRIPDFAHGEAEAEAVAEAIAPLGGLPLAIELAAPWVQIYAIDELGAALRTALLAHLGPADSPLHAALAWTWGQLDADVRRVARHGALFEAPFTLTRLRQLVGPGVAPALRVLREHDLVGEVARADDRAARRFAMSAIVRAWCRARWSPDALDAAFVEHARLFAGPAEVALDAILWANAAIGAVPVEALADLRAAVRRREALPDDVFVALVLRAHRALLDCGPGDLHRRVLDAALAAAPAEHRTARALWLARGQTLWFSDGPAAAESFERARAAAVEHGDDEVELSATAWLGLAAGLRGARDEADARLARAVALAAGRSPRIVAEVLHHVAMDHLLRRRFDDAAGVLRTALAHARLAGAAGLEYVVRMNLGFLHGERGEFAQALEHRTAAVACIEALSSPRNLPDALAGRGHLLLQLGRLDEAEAMLVAAARHHARLGNERGRCRSVGRLGQVCIEQDRLAEAATLCLDAERGLSAIGEARGAGLNRALRGLTLMLDGAPGAAVEPIESGAAELIRGGEVGRPVWLAQIARLARAWAGRPDTAAPVAEPPPWMKPAMVRLRAALALFDGGDEDDRARAARLLGVEGDGCFEGRVARRLLSMAFDEADARAGAAGGPVLRAAGSGRWFQLDDGPVVDLSKRTHPRRLLAALVVARRRTPGRRLDRDALFAAGWPGESVVPTAVGQRVHTAIYTLRRAGLAPVIERDHAGWRLAPTVHLLVEGADTTR